MPVRPTGSPPGSPPRRCATCWPTRDVLVLVAWEQLSYQEVAVALGIPAGTVRSRLNRARTKVRAALGDADPTRTGEGRA